MKHNKSYILAIFTATLLVLFGCVSKNNIIPIDPNPDPDVPYISSTPHYYGDNYFEMETDYSNITVTIEHDSYPLDTERINTTITNTNVAKGFTFYDFPLLEFYQDGEWVRLSYYPNDYYSEISKWPVCGLVNNTTDCYSTVITFLPRYVQEDLIPGQYRLVYFVGPRVLYQEFEFV